MIARSVRARKLRSKAGYAQEPAPGRDTMSVAERFDDRSLQDTGEQRADSCSKRKAVSPLANRTTGSDRSAP